MGSSRDIQHVADYLRNTFGYAIQLIVSHSLGSLASFHWICNTSGGQQLPAFVNVAGRYRMQVRLSICFWLPFFNIAAHNRKPTVFVGCRLY